MVLEYKEALKAHGHFSDQEKDNPREPASALLWTYYYLAQHYDHLGLTEKALNEIDAAIEHTPTLIELFVTKGRIYKVSVFNFRNVYISLVMQLYFILSMLVMSKRLISG